MTTTTPNTILEQLLIALDEIDIHAGTDLTDIVRCADLSRKAVLDLEKFLSTHTFESMEDEIHFFKIQKPQIEGRLIYYIRLLSILQLAPMADEQLRTVFWKSHLVTIEQFYREYSELHFYYRMDYTYLDPYYFTRTDQAEDIQLDNLLVVMDRRFNSRKSVHFSHFFALSLLANHLNLLVAEDPTKSPRRAFNWFKWTGTQSQLVELIYALNETGVIGGKKQSDVAPLFDFFGWMFNLKITNGHGSYLDNRMRKKNRSAFIDLLRKNLEFRYDHDDEHN